jgi:hypothetical protein
MQRLVEKVHQLPTHQPRRLHLPTNVQNVREDISRLAACHQHLLKDVVRSVTLASKHRVELRIEGEWRRLLQGQLALRLR